MLYDKTKFLSVSVATNRILAPSLTTNKALSTVPYSDPDMLQKVFYEGKTKLGVKVDIGRKHRKTNKNVWIKKEKKYGIKISLY